MAQSKTILISKHPPREKFVYANEDRTLISVVSIESINDGGTPADCESGEDLEYLGFTTDDIECKDYCAEDFTEAEWSDFIRFEV